MYRGLSRLSSSVRFFTRFLVLSLVVLHHQAWAADPTQGCDSCPSDTVCIKDMCYTVVAAPPGLDEPCVEAYCNVEKGGTCVNGECVVPVAMSPEPDSSLTTPSSVDGATPSAVTPSSSSAAAAAAAGVGLTPMAGLLCVVLAMCMYM